MAADLSSAAGRESVSVNTGTATGTTDGPASATTHRFSAAAVRDVVVAVGRFDILDYDVGGVRLHLATPVGHQGRSAGRGVWLTRSYRDNCLLATKVMVPIGGRCAGTSGCSAHHLRHPPNHAA
jgi:hypothetical protein